MHRALCQALFDDGVRHLTPELCELRQWELHRAEHQIVEITFRAGDRKPIRPRFRFDHWNELPPSVEWYDDERRRLSQLPQGPGGQLNSSRHPDTGRPFVCMAGVREYHRHPSHVRDRWENYRCRPGYDLGGIITQVWRAWLRTSP